MPSPSTSLASLRNDLSGSFMEFDNDMDRQGFIASEVLPVTEVQKQAGQFGKIPIEQLLMNRETARAPGAGYARSNFTFTKASFACEEHGAEEPVDDRQSAMYSDFFVAEQIAAMRARDVVLRNYEKRVADLIFNTSTWTGSALTTSITQEWDDLANAIPITDVEAAVQRVYDNSGLRANTLIIGWKVFRNIRNGTKSGQLIDRIKYSGIDDPKAGNITTQVLAQAFGIDRVLVGGSVRNSAAEGAAASLTMLWSGEYAMICRTATGQDFREPCVGRTFHWGEDGSSIGGTVESYREEAARADIIRMRMDTDEIVLYAEAGHLLTNITT